MLGKRKGYVEQLVRQRVVVYTVDDHTIRGFLKGEYPDGILIDEPEYLDEAKSESLNGPAFVPRANLSWLQVTSNDGS